MAGYLDGRWPFQLRIPRLQSALLPVQGQIQEEERWAGPPGSGPRSRRGWGQRQPRRLAGAASASPRDVPTYAAATPGCGAPEPAGPLCRYPIGAQRQKEALSPQRPGQAICRLPSPTLAPLSGPDRPGHPRPSPSRPPEPGGSRRAVTWSSAPESLGRLGPRAQDRDPREQEAAERGKGGRGSDGGRGGAGGLGAPAGWEDGAHSQSWTRDRAESGREDPLFVTQAWGGEGRGCEG